MRVGDTLQTAAGVKLNCSFVLSSAGAGGWEKWEWKS